MVFDFKNLAFIKVFLDDYLDHKFIIDINDPMFYRVTGRMPLEVQRHENGLGYLLLTPETPEDNEITESFVVVDFVPTSERLCKFLFDHIQKILGAYGVTVSKVTFNETPKSEAVYV